MGVASAPSPSRDGVVEVEYVALPQVGLFRADGGSSWAESMKKGSEYNEGRGICALLA